MNYRIYKNVKGWELVDVKQDFYNLLKVVENLLNEGVVNFIVIEHDNKFKMDTPIMISETDYLFHKKEYEGKNECRKVHEKYKL